jgi:serine/threonine protein kinase
MEPPNELISLNPHNNDFDVQWNHSLGSGYSGQVRPALCRRTKREFAVKMIPDTHRSRIEVVAMLRIGRRSSKVVKVHHVYRNALRMFNRTTKKVMDGPAIPHLLIFMEKISSPLPKADLLSYIQHHKHLPECQVREFARDVLDVLALMHSMRLVHGDIKPENMLVDDELSLKLTDFGFCGYEGEIRAPHYTLPYMPPELVRIRQEWKHSGSTEQGISAAMDMWSLGVALYVMLTNAYPFGYGATAEARILSGRYVSLAKRRLDVSQELVCVVNALLNPDASLRPTANELQQYAWFQAPPSALTIDPTVHSSGNDTACARECCMGRMPLRKQAAVLVGK